MFDFGLTASDDCDLDTDSLYSDSSLDIFDSGIYL